VGVPQLRQYRENEDFFHEVLYLAGPLSVLDLQFHEKEDGLLSAELVAHSS